MAATLVSVRSTFLFSIRIGLVRSHQDLDVAGIQLLPKFILRICIIKISGNRPPVLAKPEPGITLGSDFDPHLPTVMLRK